MFSASRHVHETRGHLTRSWVVFGAVRTESITQADARAYLALVEVDNRRLKREAKEKEDTAKFEEAKRDAVKRKRREAYAEAAGLMTTRAVKTLTKMKAKNVRSSPSRRVVGRFFSEFEALRAGRRRNESWINTDLVLHQEAGAAARGRQRCMNHGAFTPSTRRCRRERIGSMAWRFVLHRRVDLHAIDATRARWRGDAGSSLVDLRSGRQRA